MPATRLVRTLTAIVFAALAVLTPAMASADADAGLAAGITPVPASVSADFSADIAAAVSADVDDFSYASWDARYEIMLDRDGRARMHVTEALTARFPDFDQNRGIVRGFPTTYENAWLGVEVLGVTDEDGTPVPFEIEEDEGLLFVLTGDDDYVHGLTTYVIEYEMRDVILSRDDGRADEFYWDLLPQDSTQPIESFRAEIAFDEAMSDRLTGSSRCYLGFYGSTDECTLTQGDGDVVFSVEQDALEAGEGVTVAIGFDAGTVMQPPARQPNTVTDTVPALAAAGGLLLSGGGWIAVSAFTRSRRRATGIVVAQYDVPDGMPPLLAGAIVPGSKDVIPAEIVHLAVRGTLRIEEGPAPEEPRLRRFPGSRIPDQLDVEALEVLFAGADAQGVVDLPSSSETFAGRMRGLAQSGKDAAASRGLTTRARSRGAAVLQWCAIGVTVVGFGLALFGVVTGRVTAIPALVAAAFGVALMVISSFYTFSKKTVLTAEGALQLEYLMGVREFIRVAEADRLRMLQSYTGAERRQDGTANVIVVYERLLPYAMLFGMEEQWGEILEYVYAYERRGASWIGDPSGPFLRTQLAAFAMSSHAAATYSTPTSSSSGGSSGGGFSGGGGGGGFSGGR